MQDVTHHHDVRLRQGLLEEASRGERDAVGHARSGDVVLEDRRDLGQVEALTAQVRIGERHLGGEIALGGAHVHEGRCTRPRGTCGRSSCSRPC